MAGVSAHLRGPPGVGRGPHSPVSIIIGTPLRKDKGSLGGALYKGPATRCDKIEHFPAI